MANWQFPQAFGWGWLKRRETKGQRAPTQKEMANMGWQAIAGGANGLIFYAYQHLSEPHDDPEDAFEPAWARTKAMAEEFKKYITSPCVRGDTEATRIFSPLTARQTRRPRRSRSRRMSANSSHLISALRRRWTVEC